MADDPKQPVISLSMEDFLTPGVMVEVTPDEAEAMGAFEETALDEADAWDSNDDLPDEAAGLLTRPALTLITGGRRGG
jgi:hypothetical protein